MHLFVLYGFASFLLLSIATFSERKKKRGRGCFVCQKSCILNTSVSQRVSRSLHHCVRLSVTLKREVCEGSQAGAGGAGLAAGNVNMCVYSFSLFFCLQFCLTASLRRPGKPESSLPASGCQFMAFLAAFHTCSCQKLHLRFQVLDT